MRSAQSPGAPARAVLLAMACGVGLSLLAAPVSAQSYATRPITIIVAFPAGGPTDIVTRLLAPVMGAELGQQVVVENVGGAAGTVGVARAARAAADGHTLLLHNISHATAPALYKSLSYDPIADFEPIGLLADVPQTVVSKSGLAPKNTADLVAYLKANAGKVNMANAGRGSGSWLCGLLLTSAIGAPLTQVAYRGTGPALNDIVGGQVDVMCDQITNTIGQIRGGKIQPYCVTTKSRSVALPDVPACAEAGLPGFEASVWHGLYAPKGTPPAALEQINKALKTALADKTVIQRLADLGTAPAPDADVSPAALRAHLAAQVGKWGKTLDEAKIVKE